MAINTATGHQRREGSRPLGKSKNSRGIVQIQVAKPIGAMMKDRDASGNGRAATRAL